MRGSGSVIYSSESCGSSAKEQVHWSVVHLCASLEFRLEFCDCIKFEFDV